MRTPATTASSSRAADGRARLVPADREVMDGESTPDGRAGARGTGETRVEPRSVPEPSQRSAWCRASTCTLAHRRSAGKTGGPRCPAEPGPLAASGALGLSSLGTALTTLIDSGRLRCSSPRPPSTCARIPSRDRRPRCGRRWRPPPWGTTSTARIRRSTPCRSARLQERTAALLGKEAALWLPTGTMANQVALRVLTRPGDDVIVSRESHTGWHEAGAPAANSGVQLTEIGTGGVFTCEEFLAA